MVFLGGSSNIYLLSATLAPTSVSHQKMTDDRALISGVIGGDEKAVRQLVEQHQRLVAHMVARIVKRQEDLEELCQDVFMTVITKLPGFAFQSRLSTWIATIAYRHAINHLRKNKLMMEDWKDDEAWAERFVETENPEGILSEKDADEWVMGLIEQLPLQYRTVLTLYHLDGMNYSEIGAITEMPEGTVKNYLFRARNLLKEKVKQYLSKEESI
jgi:RNA polymerase sigma factor (sigma-70 family)